jgi:prepilin-type N-terminal cleavage/methylation domain-containing protein
MNKRIGFSLVEVLVALVVFALVVAGLTSVFVAGGKLITHNRERMTSSELGKLFVDPLQADVRMDTWDSGSNELRLGTRNGVAQTINNRTFNETHSVVDNTSDANLAGTTLRRVISTMCWTEPSP